MDPAGAWWPCEFQMANLTPIEEEPAAADLPAAERAALDIFGTCRLPWPYAPESCSLPAGQQLVEHHLYSAAARHSGPSDVDQVRLTGGSAGGSASAGIVALPSPPDEGTGGHSNTTFGRLTHPHDGRTRISNSSPPASGGVTTSPTKLIKEFQVNIDMMNERMHRYPASLNNLNECYTLPRIVAIGPYHRHVSYVKQAEQVKRVAAYLCGKQSVHSSEEGLYRQVVKAADDARRLYNKDATEGIPDDDFRHMMFYDACFLVQYIMMQSGNGRIIKKDTKMLHGFLRPNRIDILHDVMLLENQLPWSVLDAVIVSLEDDLNTESLMKGFVSKLRGCLQDLDPGKTERSRHVMIWDGRYTPPHLLGLVRYYIVGRTRCCNSNELDNAKHKYSDKRSASLSAIDLATIGIKVTPNQPAQPELIHMGLKRGAVSTELYMAPLALDRNRASHIVNMAAHELCTVESFSSKDCGTEDSAVCSYLLLLSMLVSREEDVQELRLKGLLHGGGGLTNKEVLDFFSSVRSIRLGKRYTHILKLIENYKEDSPVWTKLHAFWYNNKTAIGAFGAAIGTAAGVIGTLVSIKQAIHP
ncbi:hypothetical protein BS78_05G261900 [Paspalum vaginatum]|nr:hypothetical protein BS78_05G261900 [Paspalum vaginatum]